MQRLLSIGSDHTLLSVREAVLQRTGVGVYSASPLFALRLLETQPFDLVVLCHTLTQLESEEICHLVEKNWTATRIISLGHLFCTTHSGSPYAEETDWHNGPAALIRLAQRLMKEGAVKPKATSCVNDDRSPAKTPRPRHAFSKVS